MKFEIKFPELEQADEFAEELKDKNLRGVKVSQAEKEPEDGSLDMAEYMPLIMLAVKSGLATAVVTQVFGLLKNGFFTENKKIKSNERIEMEKIKTERQKNEANKEIEQQKNENQANKIEFSIECNEKKINFTLTKGDDEERKAILNAISEC